MLPQKMPARMIRAGPRTEGFDCFMYRITSCVRRVLPQSGARGDRVQEYIIAKGIVKGKLVNTVKPVYRAISGDRTETQKELSFPGKWIIIAKISRTEKIYMPADDAPMLCRASYASGKVCSDGKKEM